jgi:hypothetical protein
MDKHKTDSQAEESEHQGVGWLTRKHNAYEMLFIRDCMKKGLHSLSLDTNLLTH